PLRTSDGKIVLRGRSGAYRPDGPFAPSHPRAREKVPVLSRRVSLPSDPSQIYLGGEPVEDERRATKHRLVSEVKRVIDNAALLDVGANDTEVLEGFAADAGRLADKLEQA